MVGVMFVWFPEANGLYGLIRGFLPSGYWVTLRVDYRQARRGAVGINMTRV